MTKSEYQLSAEFARRGFMPHWPVVECTHELTLDDVFASLRQSTFNHPKAVKFEHEFDGMGDLPLRVAITSLSAVWLPNWREDGFPLGYFEHPEWRFEGRILKEALDPEREPTFVHGYLTTDLEGELDNEAYIQRVN